MHPCSWIPEAVGWARSAPRSTSTAPTRMAFSLNDSLTPDMAKRVRHACSCTVTFVGSASMEDTTASTTSWNASGLSVMVARLRRAQQAISWRDARTGNVLRVQARRRRGKGEGLVMERGRKGTRVLGEVSGGKEHGLGLSAGQGVRVSERTSWL